MVRYVRMLHTMSVFPPDDSGAGGEDATAIRVDHAQGMLVGDGGTQSNQFTSVAADRDAYVAERGDIHVHLERAAWVAFGSRPAPASFQTLGPADKLDPLRDLQVRRVTEASEPARSSPSLTRYFERDHDRELRSVIGAAVDGPSVFAYLIGGSTVGKTRALYEAICSVTPEWPVVWPHDANELLHWIDSGNITSGMVLWLDEAQEYLDGEIGSKVAAGLDPMPAAFKGNG